MAKILIVDDSASIRQTLSFTLKSMGNYEVVEASNGEEALRKFEVNQIAFVISDYNMPGMNGVELVWKLRESKHNKGIPILLLTTESDSNMKAEGKAAGATGWVVKPFSPDKMLETINKLLG